MPHFGTKLDSLYLSAGLTRSTAAKEVFHTRQNFELTIGTNHLGHFFFTNFILPLTMRMDGGGSNIVVTASGVHDADGLGGAEGSKAMLVV